MVIDASAVVDVLAVEPPGGSIAKLLSGETLLHAPTHIGVEVVNSVRRLVRKKIISPERGEETIEDFLALPIQQHRFEPLAHRVWTLRDNLSSYDAAYVAVAENLNQTLYTKDARLGKAAGPRCQIVVL
ncbi:MAG: type II toxin-antitoxin system VapC family toxin [Candidatus Dormibacteraceae bacterium]